MELGFIESLRSGHEEEEDGGNATRKEIMDGAIVKLVISNAAKCESVPGSPYTCLASLWTQTDMCHKHYAR